MEPGGSNQVLIGDTVGNDGTESSGVLDVSGLLGYVPGSVILSNNQGSPSSLAVLINPDATLDAEPCPADADDADDASVMETLIAGEDGKFGASAHSGTGVHQKRNKRGQRPRLFLEPC